MSVFTPVSHEQAAAFLADYALGELRSLEGIAEGIENSNFFVSTDSGRYVLTLFERTPAEDLPYFLGVMGHLAAAGIPCAQPLRDRAGQSLKRLNGRAATLVQRLQGRACETPSPAQCATLGMTLARMHQAAADFPGSRANCRGPDWWTAAAQRLESVLPAAQAELLGDEIAVQAASASADLPRGVIHADLFRDNALFDGERLSGLIDFYYACNEAWLYDLAVCVNDWILVPQGTASTAQYPAMVEAYAGQRPFSAAERKAWPQMLRAAALRFWVSRLVDWHFPRPGEMTYAKDPAVFETILRQHRAQPPVLP